MYYFKLKFRIYEKIKFCFYILLLIVLCVGCDSTLKLSNDVVFDLNKIELTNNKEINTYLNGKGEIYGQYNSGYAL